MPSRTDTAGHTKAFIYPVMDHWGKAKVLRHKADSKADLSANSRTCQPPDHDNRPKSEDQLYPGPQGGGGGCVCVCVGLPPIGGSLAIPRLRLGVAWSRWVAPHCLW